MRNCEIVNEAFYDGKYYCEIITKNSGKHFYYKGFSDLDLKVISKKEYDKAINSKGLPIKNRIARKIVLPIMLSGVITSSISGCSKEKENKVEPTRIEVQDNKEQNNYINDVDYYKEYTIDDFKKWGIDVELETNYSEAYQCAIYKINNIDLAKVPKSVLFENFDTNLNLVPNIDLDINVTWDDCIKEIEKKDIEEKYKKILINLVEKYKTLGLEKGLPIFYNNIKKSEFIRDYTHPSAMFVTTKHQLIIGNADIKEDKKFLESVKIMLEMGELTEEEYNDVLTEEEYILSHEPGHMITTYYDDETGEKLDFDCYYAAVDPKTKKVQGIIQLGRFVGEGFSDYITYESINRKACRMYGYPINQCFYIACKEILKLESNEELRTLSSEKLIEKFRNIGFESPFDWAAIFERIVNLDYEALYNPEEGIREIDTTDIIECLFQEYYETQINNGVSKEEIKKVFDKIINEIRDRIVVTYEDDSLMIKGTFGYTTLCTSCLEEYANEIVNQKLYSK